MSAFERPSEVSGEPAPEIAALDEGHLPRAVLDPVVPSTLVGAAGASARELTALPWLVAAPFASMLAANASAAPAAQWALWAAAAFADHLSGKFATPPPRGLGVLWVDRVRSRPMGYAAALHGSPQASPTKNPVRFDFRDGNDPRPLELGVLQEVRLVVWRCRRPRPELLKVRFFTSARTLQRGVKTLIAVPLDRHRLSHAEAYIVDAAEKTFTESSLCDAVAHTPTKSASPPVPPRRSHHLRVMSYNVWNFNSPWLDRCNAIAKVVRAEAPDAVLFQEVRIDADGPLAPTPLRAHPRGSRASNDTTMHPDVVDRRSYYRHSKMQSEHLMRHIRGKIPYWFDALPAMTYRPEMDQSEGPRNAFPHAQAEGPMIAHKLRTLGTFPLFLPRTGDTDEGHEDGDDHQRMALCHAVAVPVPSAVAAAKQVRVDLCTTHFSLSRRAQMLNAQSASAQIAALAGRELDGMRAAHTVFAGDLNAEQDSETIEWLLRDSPDGAGFTDAYQRHEALRYPSSADLQSDPCAKLRREREDALGEAAVAAERDADGLGPHGFTFSNLDDALVKRIDFVLARPGPAANGTALCPIAMRHRGHRTEAGFSPSDHLAVVVDYAVVGAPQAEGGAG